MHCAGHTACTRPPLRGRAASAAAGGFQRAAPRRNPRSGCPARTSFAFHRATTALLPCYYRAPVTSRARARGHVGPPEAVPRCGSVGYDPGGGVVAATAACRDRIRLPTRALSLRRDPSLVAHGRSSSSSQPLAAATCPCRPCDPVFHPPAPPHHPCVMERRCPAAGGVKHARGGVRHGVITHHPLVPSGTHDGQGLAPTTRACVAPRAA